MNRSLREEPSKWGSRIEKNPASEEAGSANIKEDKDGDGKEH